MFRNRSTLHKVGAEAPVAQGVEEDAYPAYATTSNAAIRDASAANYVTYFCYGTLGAAGSRRRDVDPSRKKGRPAHGGGSLALLPRRGGAGSRGAVCAMTTASAFATWWMRQTPSESSSRVEGEKISIAIGCCSSRLCEPSRSWARRQRALLRKLARVCPTFVDGHRWNAQPARPRLLRCGRRDRLADRHHGDPRPARCAETTDLRSALRRQRR